MTKKNDGRKIETGRIILGGRMREIAIGMTPAEIGERAARGDAAYLTSEIKRLAKTIAISQKQLLETYNMIVLDYEVHGGRITSIELQDEVDGERRRIQV
jgi:hypothetical protein